MVKFDVDKIKQMGCDFVESVKSSGAAQRVRATVFSDCGCAKPHHVLPHEIEERLRVVEAELKVFREMQKQTQKAGDDLQKSVRDLCRDARVLFQDEGLAPKHKPKPKPEHKPKPKPAKGE
jgi:hypothetical protein